MDFSLNTCEVEQRSGVSLLLQSLSVGVRAQESARDTFVKLLFVFPRVPLTVDHSLLSACFLSGTSGVRRLYSLAFPLYIWTPDRSCVLSSLRIVKNFSP